MRALVSIGLPLAVIFLLFLAFNLVWGLKLPTIKVDFSEHPIHSISTARNAFLSTLDTPVDLYFFNSNRAFPKHLQRGNYGKRVEGLLNEYRNLVPGKLNLHVIDPAPFSEDDYKARLFGLEDKQGFLGLIGTRAGHGAQRIEAFNPDHEALLEYEISHLIHKVAYPEQPIVGFLSTLPMDGAKNLKGQPDTPTWASLQELRRHFNLVSLAPDMEQIPAHVKTLMLVQPQSLPERTLYAIDQFVLGGGKLMMFVDPKVETTQVPATQSDSRVDALLAAWGLQMPANRIVADASYASPVILTAGESAVRHPAALALPRQAMTQNDISTLKLRTVTLLASGALIPLKRARTTLTPLLQSSAQGALFEAERFADPDAFETLIKEAATTGQRHTLAARIEGPASSAFPEGIDGVNTGLKKARQIHVVVVADTDLLHDRVWTAGQTGNTASNATFVLNTLDNLAAPPALADIRPPAAPPQATGLLQNMRNSAERAFQEKSAELQQRLARTEAEWQRLKPTTVVLSPEPVITNALLQAINKERLRLPMEIHALRQQAYAQVHTLEGYAKWLNLVVPLLLCLIALGIALIHRSRRSRRLALY